MTAIRKITPFGLRMPPELRRTVEARAEAGHRSLNSQVLWELENFPELQSRFTKAQEKIASLEKKLDEYSFLVENEDDLLPFLGEVIALYRKMLTSAEGDDIEAGLRPPKDKPKDD